MGLRLLRSLQPASSPTRTCSQFLTVLVVAAIRAPTLAAGAGAVFVIGRVLYIAGYNTGDPSARYRGIMNIFGLLALLILSFWSVAGFFGF